MRDTSPLPLFKRDGPFLHVGKRKALLKEKKHRSDPCSTKKGAGPPNFCWAKKKKTASGCERHLFPFLYSKRETPSRQTFLPSKRDRDLLFVLNTHWTRTETPSILRRNDTSSSFFQKQRNTFTSLLWKTDLPCSSKKEKVRSSLLRLLPRWKRKRHLPFPSPKERDTCSKQVGLSMASSQKKKHLPSHSQNKGSLPSRPVPWGKKRTTIPSLQKKHTFSSHDRHHPFPLFTKIQTPSLLLFSILQERERHVLPFLKRDPSSKERCVVTDGPSLHILIRVAPFSFLFWLEQKKDLPFLSSKRQERPSLLFSWNTQEELAFLTSVKKRHLPFLVQKKETTSRLLLKRKGPSVPLSQTQRTRSRPNFTKGKLSFSCQPQNHLPFSCQKERDLHFLLKKFRKTAFHVVLWKKERNTFPSLLKKRSGLKKKWDTFRSPQ